MPDPIPAHAASKRKKRKQVIDMQRARKKNDALPNLHLLDGSSSENLVGVVSDLTNHDAYTIPDHIDVSTLLFIYVNLHNTYLLCVLLISPH